MRNGRTYAGFRCCIFATEDGCCIFATVNRNNPRGRTFGGCIFNAKAGNPAERECGNNFGTKVAYTSYIKYRQMHGDERHQIDIDEEENRRRRHERLADND